MTGGSDVVEVLVCAAGAQWELELVRGLARPELGVRVRRRCVDHGELLGTALRDLPRAVLLDASLPWLDRDFVATLRRAGVEVFAIGSSVRPLDQVGAHCLPADVSPERVAVAVCGVAAPLSVSGMGIANEHGEAAAGRIVAVWGGAGSPGRTTVAVHLAVEAASSGTSTLLIDADVWSASVAQLLDLEESPSLTQAARAAAEGWPSSIEQFVHRGPCGVSVLAGLARSQLWPEVREEAWRAILAAAVEEYELVVVDVAAPIEEDEELSFDRVPYRRNVVTTVALERADDIVLVVAADPIGLRRGIVAYRTLVEGADGANRSVTVVLNRTPRPGRRLQECSAAISDWTGAAPSAFLPEEDAFERVAWEGRPLHQVATRSKWLRELRPALEGVRR